MDYDRWRYDDFSALHLLRELTEAVEQLQKDVDKIKEAVQPDD